MKVAILGGGITGIAVARTLRERGYDPHVFEADERIGGLCRSDIHDGYVHDLSGGHIIHSRDPEILQQMVDLLGPDAVACERNTKIFYRGRYVKYPFENGLGDLPVEDTFDCIRGYIDAWVARRDGSPQPDNFRDWIPWRLGDGIAQHFMYPYNEKLWCSNLKDVSTGWIAGRVPEAPYDDVLKSALGISTEGYTHQLHFYYPRTGGFETLVQRLADPVRDLIRLKTPVHRLSREAGRWEVNGEPFDAVINSIPLQELFRVLDPAPPDTVRSAVDELRYLSIATVLVGVDQPKLNDYSWIYLPHPETGPVNRASFISNFSPGNAPPGKSSLLAEVTFPGGSERPDLAALEDEVVTSLAGCGLFPAERVELVRSVWFKYAYPYYDVGFDARMEIVNRHLDGLGLHTIGRFGAYKYVNTDQVLMMVRDFFTDHFPERAGASPA